MRSIKEYWSHISGNELGCWKTPNDITDPSAKYQDFRYTLGKIATKEDLNII